MNAEAVEAYVCLDTQSHTTSSTTSHSIPSVDQPGAQLAMHTETPFHGRTDGHGGEQNGPEYDQDVAAVDVAGAVVNAVRIGFVVVGDFFSTEPVWGHVCVCR